MGTFVHARFDDAKGTKSRAFGVVESSVNVGFCGQTLLPALFSNKHFEVSAMTKQAVLFEEQVEFSRVN